MPDGSITDRLDWIHAVCLRCSDRAIKVAAIINLRWNRQSGCAWPSHASLATDIGASVDTVIRAIKELKTVGAVEVKQSCGRGLANEYRPVWSFGVKPPQTCPPFTEKTPAELQGFSDEKPPQPCRGFSQENPRNLAAKTPATLPPPTHIKNSEEKNESASATESQDLFDGSETKPVLTDRQLIQPLQGIARWLSSDPERTQTNIATMAALVREFGAQEVERHAKALFRSSGEKSWPEAIGQAIAADRALKRKPRPPPEPEDMTDKLKPKKVTA